MAKRAATPLNVRTGRRSFAGRSGALRPFETTPRGRPAFGRGPPAWRAWPQRCSWPEACRTWPRRLSTCPPKSRRPSRRWLASGRVRTTCPQAASQQQATSPPSQRREPWPTNLLHQGTRSAPSRFRPRPPFRRPTRTISRSSPTCRQRPTCPQLPRLCLPRSQISTAQAHSFRWSFRISCLRCGRRPPSSTAPSLRRTPLHPSLLYPASKSRTSRRRSTSPLPFSPS